MFSEKIYPYLLVFIQFSCLLYLFTSAPSLAATYQGILIESAGIFLGIYAIYIMRIGNFNITPQPKKNGELVTSGPYRIIRHPMYLALLMASLPLMIEYYSPLRLIIYLVLIGCLLLKIDFEEKKLKLKFPDYMDYMSKTNRLLPFIY